MLSKADQKRIKALQEGKARAAEGCFVAEGLKLTEELLGHFACELLVLPERRYPELEPLLRRLPQGTAPQRLELVPDSFDWTRISGLKQPQPQLAVLRLPQPNAPEKPEGLCLLLDRVQDPGNLGTILRTADWFGIEHIYLAAGTADPFAPKVVQATMGALARVRIHKVEDSVSFVRDFPGRRLGTYLDGTNLYTVPLPSPAEPALLIMGNEGQGIHPDLAPYIDLRLTIPPYPAASTHTESLNVAIATALLLGELRHP